MRSYKLNQTIEKNLYPIERKLDEIEEGNQKKLRQYFNLYAPVFLSALLTAIFGNSIVSVSARNIEDESLTVFEKLFNTWWGKSLCILIVFVVFTIVILFICTIMLMLLDRRDNKGSINKRNQIAKGFYKEIIPEVIAGVSLFEKAYELELADNKEDDTVSGCISAEQIVLPDNMGSSINSKAILCYYESFYHFKLTKEKLEKDQLIEYKDSDRENLKELYKLIGEEAIRRVINLCYHCVKEMCKRILNVEENEIKTYYEVAAVILKEKTGNEVKSGCSEIQEE